MSPLVRHPRRIALGYRFASRSLSQSRKVDLRPPPPPPPNSPFVITPSHTPTLVLITTKGLFAPKFRRLQLLLDSPTNGSEKRPTRSQTLPNRLSSMPSLDDRVIELHILVPLVEYTRGDRVNGEVWHCR